MSIDQKKSDKCRIMEEYEAKVLELMSDSTFKVFIFNPYNHGYKQFDNFCNLNELTKIEFDEDEIRQF